MHRVGPLLATFAAAAPLFLGAAAVSGCGFGPGESAEGEANLRVTREFGVVPMVDATLEDPTESDSVVRFLDSNADVETSYGGNFVDSIEGFEGSTGGGGEEDWFFFVNGYYSDIGAGETKVQPGDRIWWDFRYWQAAYRVPAVVGSWPEPFLHGYDGERFETVVECLGESAACDAVVSALDEAGAGPTLEETARPVEHPGDLRVLVGPWEELRVDPAARGIEAGPERSGVYGRFTRCGEAWELEIDDPRGALAGRYPDAGLVAAVRQGDDQPTWLVTGTADDAVSAAAELLDADSLTDRYAAAVVDGTEVRLPAPVDADLAPEVGRC